MRTQDEDVRTRDEDLKKYNYNKILHLKALKNSLKFSKFTQPANIYFRASWPAKGFSCKICVQLKKFSSPMMHEYKKDTKL